MKRGIMMYHFGEQQWTVWIGPRGFLLDPGAPFDIRIRNHYYPVCLMKDSDWFVTLEGVSFVLRQFEVYKVRIDMGDYIPYCVPL